MSSYLVDTGVFLWNFGQPQRLGPRVRELLKRSDSVFVSAATSWEIAIKSASGKLYLPESPRDFFRRRLATAGFLPLPITNEHALAAGELPRLHADPIDRMLVAQAQTEGMVLITGDRQLLEYSGKHSGQRSSSERRVSLPPIAAIKNFDWTASAPTS